MEETTSTVVEQAQTSDSFMEGWDEDTVSAEPADQPEEQREDDVSAAEPPKEAAAVSGEGTEAAEESPAEPEPADAPRTWTLRHLGDVHTVNEADMVSLAQKGLDYDRIRSKYDESRPIMELFSTFAKQANMSVADYAAYIRTQAKQTEGMSEAEAKRAVELEDREAVVAAREAEAAERRAAEEQEAAARTSAEERRQADIQEFQETFPEAARDPKSIPPEVWAEVRQGKRLVAAYSKYAVAQALSAQHNAEHQAEAASQNQKNAARTTGSMKTAGDSAAGKDPFLDGFGG